MTVSISVVTYNHKDYIAQCLDGILMQQTNFPFEIILGEDQSSDGTRKICIEYANKYPSKIKLFLRSRKDVIYINGNPTGRFNMLQNLKETKGKYIAFCEGDDFWTDPLKLQKQVDFLETNPIYGICFHKVSQMNRFNNNNIFIPNIENNTIFTLNDYILNNKTATCSIMFNKKFINSLPSWFKKAPFGDLAIILLVMINSNQKGYVFNDSMGVYRIHDKSIHGKFQKNNNGLIKAYKQHIQFFKMVAPKILNKSRYKKTVYRKYMNTYKLLGDLYKQNNEIFSFLIASFLSFYYRLILKLK